MRRKEGNMKVTKILAAILVISLVVITFYACKSATTTETDTEITTKSETSETKEKTQEATQAARLLTADEYFSDLPTAPVEGGAPLKDPNNKDYVWVCQYNSLPLFVNNDYIGLDAAARDFGINVIKAGPQDIDLPAFIAAIEQQIALKPAGVVVVGWDPSLQVAIDKLIDAGIPVVTDDADVPNSKRLTFIGGNWYDAGVEQAKAMAPYLEGKTGKVAVIGQQTNENTTQSYNGFKDAMSNLNPDIEVIGIYDSEADPGVTTQVATDLILSNKDLVGLAGFDSVSGPGIATAIRETGKKGQIFGTCCDAEAEHLQAVKDGYLVAAVAAKAKIETYYAMRLLYDYNNSTLNWTNDDVTNNIINIPQYVYIGFLTATPQNVDALLAAITQ